MEIVNKIKIYFCIHTEYCSQFILIIYSQKKLVFDVHFKY